jgi:hypothetical protein
MYLTNWTAVFLELNKVAASGLGDAGTSGLQLRRKLEQLKWPFTNDATAELLRRIESEKSTLSLVLKVFTAYVFNTIAYNADLRPVESLVPES